MAGTRGEDSEVTGTRGAEVPGSRETDAEEVPGVPALEVTGLSGVEDIVGEVIAKGEIDPRSVGLTREQAQKISLAPGGYVRRLDCRFVAL